jgi:hypothetical protein
MAQHVYLDNSYSEDAIVKMQSTDSTGQIFENFISEDEFNLCRRLISSIEYPEHGDTSKYAGSSYADPIGKQIELIFDNKLQQAIGPHKLDFFAFQEAINPWKVHADLRWYADQVPHKVVLVPLDVIGDEPSNEWQDTYSISFEQRNYLRNNPDTNRGTKRNNDQSKWRRPIDKLNTEELVEGYTVSREEHKKYFSHMLYEFLEGLSIDTIYKWSPCSAVVWDQDQLHCGDNFLANSIKTKLSLIFFTNQIA